MKETKFEKYLEANTLIVGKNFKTADKNPLEFEFDKREELRGGMHTLVTKVESEGKKWVIKEGRTDLSWAITKDLSLPLDRGFWGSFLAPIGIDIMPSIDKVAKDLREYFLVAKYFGFFEEDHKILGDNQFVREEQRRLRRELGSFDKKDSGLGSLAKRLLDGDEKRIKILKDAIKRKDVLNYNFLVKEYVVLSHPVKSKIKKTYYIAQEWVDGYTLENSLEEDFTKKIYGRLLVFIILAIYLFEEEQKVIDTRGAVFSNINWFATTENVIVNTETQDVRFIDTRSLWDLSGTFAEKGLLTPDMLLASFLQTFNDYMDGYRELMKK